MILLSPNNKTSGALGANNPLKAPIYSISIAAKITGVSDSTLRSWLYGYKYDYDGSPRWFSPLLTPFPRHKLYNPQRLFIGFDSIVELIYLNELVEIVKKNQDYKIKGLSQVRETIKLLKEEFCTDHPFLHPSSYGIFDNPFNEKIISLVGNIKELKYRISKLRTRIYWQEPSYPTKIFPFFQHGTFLSLSIGDTQMRVDGTQVKTTDIKSKFCQGESIEKLCSFYDLPSEVIQSALRFEI